MFAARTAQVFEEKAPLPIGQHGGMVVGIAQSILVLTDCRIGAEHPDVVHTDGVCVK